MTNRISEKVVTIPPSGIRKFFDIAATMENVISLGIGEPDFVTPDVILQAGIASLRRGETGYTSNSGTIELREAIAAKIFALYGVSYNPEEEVLVTVGVSEALYLALNAILNPGDQVIVPQPCFVSYTSEVVLAGGEPVIVDARFENNFEVTAADIEAVITPRTRALLIGYPNNPTGAVLSRTRMEEIAQVAEQHDLLVISDEIYDRLVYGDHRHTCFAGLPGMRDRTLLLGGLSKNYAMTGWRIGYTCAPADLLAAMRKIHQYTIMSAPTTAQAASVQALTDPRAEDAVQEMRGHYDRRRRLIVDGLNEIGLSTFEPQGAFYAFPNVEISGMDEDTFAWTLLEEEEVAVVPGTAFGQAGTGFVRCSYATSMANIEEALQRMHHFVRRHG